MSQQHLLRDTTTNVVGIVKEGGNFVVEHPHITTGLILAYYLPSVQTVATGTLYAAAGIASTGITVASSFPLTTITAAVLLKSYIDYVSSETNSFVDNVEARNEILHESDINNNVTNADDCNTLPKILENNVNNYSDSQLLSQPWEEFSGDEISDAVSENMINTDNSCFSNIWN